MTAAAAATPFPRDPAPDSTFGLLREGYNFITNRCRRLRTEAFEARIMLARAVCAQGEDAARMFYHPGRFTRRGAIPPTALLSLQDRGSVATLDGEAHRHRKQLFLALARPESIAQLTGIFAEEWKSALPRWKAEGEVVLHDAVTEVLCRAACRWAGVPLPEEEVRKRSREFGAMIDGAGSVGPRNWKGLLLRRRTESWARDLIDRVREKRLYPPEGSALYSVAWHRDPKGEPLNLKTAGVELVNVLRPTVAVAYYVTFAAHALDENPECRERLAAHGEAYLEAFAEEVRRFYPFFPAVGGRVLEPFDWRGRHFEKGEWVLLDLYGTNHDPRIWGDPEAFKPERFLKRQRSRFNFVPQGGGDYNDGHRCPGEPVTVELIKEAVKLLTTATRYDVPEQDLSIDLSRIPAIPASRFEIVNVRAASVAA